MGISPETHNWTMQRVRDFGALSSKWDVFVMPLPSRLRDPYRRGGRKSIRAGGMGVSKKLSSRHNRIDAHVNSRRPWQQTQDLHKFKSDGVPAQRWGSRHRAPLLTQEAIYNQYTLSKRKKSIVSNGVSPGVISHIQGRSHGKEQ